MTKTKRVVFCVGGIFIILALVVTAIIVWNSYHPYGYSKTFIIGSDYAEIVEKYGEFDRVDHDYYTKEITSGYYMVEDEGARSYFGGLVVLGHKGRTYLVVEFDDNDVAESVYVTEWNVGG